MKIWTHSLTNKFVIVMAAALIVLFGLLVIYEGNQAKNSAEDRMFGKGHDSAITLAHTLQSITERDLQTGILFEDGTSWSGEELRERLFNDKLELIPESEQVAQKRLDDPDYAAAEVELFNGEKIPQWQYELKYESAYDQYTNSRWQEVIDNFLTDDRVIYAIPIAHSEQPEFTGYIATHNTIYREGTDQWGDSGVLSQEYRANRVFNDITGYNAAQNTNTDDVLVQEYDRVIDGQTVRAWDVSYPLYFEGEHWGAVRVALSLEEADAAIAQAQVRFVLPLLGVMVLVLAILFILTRTMLSSKLRNIVAATTNLNAGEADLTYRIAVSGHDEVAQLGHEINRFIDYLQKLVATIRQQSEEMDERAHQLTEGAKGGRQLAGQLAKSVQEMASGAQSQAAATAESAQAMEEMAAGIGKIADSSSVVAEAADNMVNEAEQGNESSANAARQMDVLRQSATSAAEVINQLDAQSAQIGEMAQVISGIADQTNLLALNASIEAARAGEHGSGFAVVAEEIRKLADQAADSASHITEMTEQVFTLTKQAVEAMRKGESEVGEGLAAVRTLRHAFDRIVASSQQVSEQIQDVSAASEQLAAGSEQVTASIEEMSRIARNTSTATEKAAADTREKERIAVTMFELSSSVHQLADELQKAIDRFKIK